MTYWRAWFRTAAGAAAAMLPAWARPRARAADPEGADGNG